MLSYTTYLHDSSQEWVTFIHGAGGSSAIWFRQVKAFKLHSNVLLIDLRGHGDSKLPAYEKMKRYTFEQIGDDIIEVLDHLQLAQTHFVGISLGTILIRDIAERYPERAGKLVMAGAIMKLNGRGQFFLHMGILLNRLVPYLLLYRLFALVVMPRKEHSMARRLFVEEAKKLGQAEFQRWFTLAPRINRLLRAFRRKDTSMPTLYVMGEEDHMFLPIVRQIVAAHAHATLYVIPDCGHVVNVQEPEVFNEQALAFLAAPVTK